MRFGIIILADQRWQDSARRWRLAEDYGFDHAWTYDHLGWRSLVDGPWFDAVPTLTAAAMVTSRIALGLGAGAGGASFDTRVLGEPPLSPRERVDRFAEFAELLDMLLRTDRVTWTGRYYRAVDARNLPGCVQQPRIPFVMAANGPRSIALAARFGDGWVTTGGPANDLAAWWRGVGEAARRLDDALTAAGRDPAAVPRYLSLDAAGVYALSSVAYLADAAGRAGDLGFTDIITHWPRPDGPYAGQESVLADAAAALLTGSA